MELDYPIGCIKKIKIDDTWVEMNGQILNDKDSPFNGLRIRNYNNFYIKIKDEVKEKWINS